MIDEYAAREILGREDPTHVRSCVFGTYIILVLAVLINNPHASTESRHTQSSKCQTIRSNTTATRIHCDASRAFTPLAPARYRLQCDKGAINSYLKMPAQRQARGL